MLQHVSDTSTIWPPWVIRSRHWLRREYRGDSIRWREWRGGRVRNCSNRSISRTGTIARSILSRRQGDKRMNEDHRRRVRREGNVTGSLLCAEDQTLGRASAKSLRVSVGGTEGGLKRRRRRRRKKRGRRRIGTRWIL